MTARHIQSEALFAFFYGRVHDRNHQHPIFHETYVRHHRFRLLSNHDRHDVGIAFTEVEADIGEALAHVRRLLLQLAD